MDSKKARAGAMHPVREVGDAGSRGGLVTPGEDPRGCWGSGNPVGGGHRRVSLPPITRERTYKVLSQLSGADLATCVPTGQPGRRDAGLPS